MDVRETAELDEDERFITIADGSDTGIVNNQVPEADIIRYKDSTYEIVSKIAYLIGVPKRIFENEHEPPKMEVYERLEQDKAARIIRHLCIIRTTMLAPGDRDHILSGVFNQFLSALTEPVE